MNRVQIAIDKRRKIIADRLAAGIVTQKQADKLDRTLDITAGELVKFQELKSVAFIEGKLSQEEASTIYLALGETAEHFNKQPLEVKSVVTQILSELLDAKIKARERV